MSKQFKHIEGTGKPLKVVAPIKADDITKGKEYPVIRPHLHELKGGYIFDDTGFELLIRYDGTGCLHLGGKNWIVTERAPE